jgi:hypothetical protein
MSSQSTFKFILEQRGSECDKTRGRIDNQPKRRVPPHYNKPQMQLKTPITLCLQDRCCGEHPYSSVGLELLMLIMRAMDISTCFDAERT